MHLWITIAIQKGKRAIQKDTAIYLHKIQKSLYKKNLSHLDIPLN